LLSAPSTALSIFALSAASIAAAAKPLAVSAGTARAHAFRRLRCPAQQGRCAKTTTAATARQTARQYQASQLVFLTTFLIVFALDLVILVAAADLVSQSESSKTATTATAGQPTRQYQASQLMFLTAFLIVVALHLVILVAAADLVSQSEGGKTATAANQPTREYQASQPVFLTAFLVVFVLLAFGLDNPVSEREAGELAAPVHAAGKKNLGHVAFISVAVQAVIHGFTFGHCISFRWFLRELRHARDAGHGCEKEVIGSR
jgi:hypothetical protein